ncbi:MAG TPA: zinc ribbon domain-containing protein [Coleofasciculaceae cyanobacterium]
MSDRMFAVALTNVALQLCLDKFRELPTCHNCNHHTGKKELSERVHHCGECGYITDRDVAAAQVVMQRRLAAVEHTVERLGEGLSASSPLLQ